MRYAIKRKCKTVKAYELGRDSAMELSLLQEGTLQRRQDGSYLVFSLETVNGMGEVAQPGDYIKVDSIDGRLWAYPNARQWFLEHHRHVAGDAYEQISVPLVVWMAGDPIEDAAAYLLRSGRLHIDENCEDRYFNAFLWGAPLSAARDAVVVFYNIERDAHEEVCGADFGLVNRRVFERDYILCDASGEPVK